MAVVAPAFLPKLKIVCRPLVADARVLQQLLHAVALNQSSNHVDATRPQLAAVELVCSIKSSLACQQSVTVTADAVLLLLIADVQLQSLLSLADAMQGRLVAAADCLKNSVDVSLRSADVATRLILYLIVDVLIQLQFSSHAVVLQHQCLAVVDCSRNFAVAYLLSVAVAAKLQLLIADALLRRRHRLLLLPIAVATLHQLVVATVAKFAAWLATSVLVLAACCSSIAVAAVRLLLLNRLADVQTLRHVAEQLA